jgi:hypothetical protein
LCAIDVLDVEGKIVLFVDYGRVVCSRIASLKLAIVPVESSLAVVPPYILGNQRISPPF